MGKDKLKTRIAPKKAINDKGERLKIQALTYQKLAKLRKKVDQKMTPDKSKLEQKNRLTKNFQLLLAKISKLQVGFQANKADDFAKRCRKGRGYFTDQAHILLAASIGKTKEFQLAKAKFEQVIAKSAAQIFIKGVEGVNFNDSASVERGWQLWKKYQSYVGDLWKGDRLDFDPQIKVRSQFRLDMIVFYQRVVFAGRKLKPTILKKVQSMLKLYHQDSGLTSADKKLLTAAEASCQRLINDSKAPPKTPKAPKSPPKTPKLPSPTSKKKPSKTARVRSVATQPTVKIDARVAAKKAERARIQKALSRLREQGKLTPQNREDWTSKSLNRNRFFASSVLSRINKGTASFFQETGDFEQQRKISLAKKQITELGFSLSEVKKGLQSHLHKYFFANGVSALRSYAAKTGPLKAKIKFIYQNVAAVAKNGGISVKQALAEYYRFLGKSERVATARNFADFLEYNQVALGYSLKKFAKYLKLQRQLQVNAKTS